MQEFGKYLIAVGLIIAGTGVLLAFFGKIPGLGKLPGDIVIRRGDFTFYFPIATCILLSILFSLIAVLMKRH